MTLSEAIIIAAKRYCTDNFKYWVNEHTKMTSGIHPRYSFSDTIILISRYSVLNAIADEIEYFTGTEFADAESCKKALKEAAEKAQNDFTKAPVDKIAVKMIQDEREKFLRFIDSFEQDSLKNIEPLPYRRRLRSEETTEITAKLKSNWDFDGHWVPLRQVRSDIQTVFFAQEHLSRKDLEDIYEYVIKNIKHRIFEIGEDQTAYEIDPAGFVPSCHKTVYCDQKANWLIYGSHEGTIAFGGKWLLDFIDDKFKDRKELINLWRKKDDSDEWPSDEWKDWNTM